MLNTILEAMMEEPKTNIVIMWYCMRCNHIEYHRMLEMPENHKTRLRCQLGHIQTVNILDERAYNNFVGKWEYLK